MVSPLAWVRSGRRIDWPRVLLVALVLTVVIAVGYVGATSGAAFAPYNPAWDGASDLRTVVDDDPTVMASYETDTEAYDEGEPNETVAFVIAPDEPYGDADAAAVRSFVEDGGTLVVMENFGSAGDALLHDVGANASIDGAIVRDERNHFAAPTMPIATNVSPHDRTAGVEQLTLNYASVIDPDGATVLVRTSEYAYLVEEPDTEIDDDDELASMPVATVESVGDGEVVTVADPSMAINVMLAEPDNERFLANQWDDRDRVLFDLSHAPGLPPLMAVTLAIRGSAILQGTIGLLGVVMAVGLTRRWEDASRFVRSRFPGRWGPAPSDRARELSVSDAERAAYLRRQHPDWDGERIDRVIAALNHDDGKAGEQ